ncbi:hypothetical protein CAOG_00762 [Capsaspora owczarzaki ATCC 30864]|uniref:Uncharacterized protein n=1 Tax=Capsaspora owczarzaki (strain ATCC 30864) TaxID=595528 RepID=A0A0D2WJ49_CAPO3|nr:hypothetical protein CAOG_00762 [Capsaspora owczarzaki ATCC 30864]KJE89253.1 hypothetical protein CAOG_000762 [Capsaspora owczarzaki ATCC 30864]|eukprot:XP_004365633.1 hypothetical protein CAOG_00762 [Capsaspora owczarzaki ATCC 30864]
MLNPTSGHAWTHARDAFRSLLALHPLELPHDARLGLQRFLALDQASSSTLTAISELETALKHIAAHSAPHGANASAVALATALMLLPSCTASSTAGTVDPERVGWMRTAAESHMLRPLLSSQAKPPVSSSSSSSSSSSNISQDAIASTQAAATAITQKTGAKNAAKPPKPAAAGASPELARAFLETALSVIENHLAHDSSTLCSHTLETLSLWSSLVDRHASTIAAACTVSSGVPALYTRILATSAATLRYLLEGLKSASLRIRELLQSSLNHHHHQQPEAARTPVANLKHLSEALHSSLKTTLQLIALGGGAFRNAAPLASLEELARALLLLVASPLITREPQQFALTAWLHLLSSAQNPDRADHGDQTAIWVRTFSSLLAPWADQPLTDPSPTTPEAALATPFTAPCFEAHCSPSSPAAAITLVRALLVACPSRILLARAVPQQANCLIVQILQVISCCLTLGSSATAAVRHSALQTFRLWIETLVGLFSEADQRAPSLDRSEHVPVEHASLASLAASLLEEQRAALVTRALWSLPDSVTSDAAQALRAYFSLIPRLTRFAGWPVEHSWRQIPAFSLCFTRICQAPTLSRHRYAFLAALAPYIVVHELLSAVPSFPWQLVCALAYEHCWSVVTDAYSALLTSTRAAALLTADIGGLSNHWADVWLPAFAAGLNLHRRADISQHIATVWVPVTLLAMPEALEPLCLHLLSAHQSTLSNLSVTVRSPSPTSLASSLAALNHDAVLDLDLLPAWNGTSSDMQGMDLAAASSLAQSAKPDFAPAPLESHQQRAARVIMLALLTCASSLRASKILCLADFPGLSHSPAAATTTTSLAGNSILSQTLAQRVASLFTLDFIASAATSGDPLVQAATLTFLAPVKATEPLTVPLLQLFSTAMHACLNTSFPPLRFALIGSARRIFTLVRAAATITLRTVTHEWGVLNKKQANVSLESILERHQSQVEMLRAGNAFFAETLDVLLEGIVPGSTFQRTTIALSLLAGLVDVLFEGIESGPTTNHAALDCWPQPMLAKMHIPAEADAQLLRHQLWVPVEPHSSRVVATLLQHLAYDTFEVNRALSRNMLNGHLRAGHLLAALPAASLASTSDADVHRSASEATFSSRSTSSSTSSEFSPSVLSGLEQACSLRAATSDSGVQRVATLFKLQHGASVEDSRQFLARLVAMGAAQVDALRSDSHATCSSTSPHGVLACLHACLQHVAWGRVFGSDACEQTRWSEWLAALLSVVEQMVPAALDSLAINDAITATMAGEAAEDEAACDDDDLQDESNDQHIIVRTSIWLTLRTICDLLGALVEAIGLPNETAQSLSGVLSLSVAQVRWIGRIYLQILTSVRHRGIVERGSEAFANLCQQLLATGRVSLVTLPCEWLVSILHTLEGVQVSVTRRSAGYPFVIASILAALVKHHYVLPVVSPALVLGSSASASASAEGSADDLLSRVVTSLFALASKPVSLDADQTVDLVQVHALNVLRALFADSSLSASHMQRFCAHGMVVALEGLCSPSWAVRNSSTMLASALTFTLVTLTRLNQDESRAQRISPAVLFARYPALLPQLRDLLLKHQQPDQPLREQSSMQSALVLLGKLGSDVDPSDIPGALANDILDLRDVIAFARKSPIQAVRIAAAQATVALTPVSDRPQLCINVLEMLQVLASVRTSSNELHGLLLLLDAALTTTLPDFVTRAFFAPAHATMSPFELMQQLTAQQSTLVSLATTGSRECATLRFGAVAALRNIAVACRALSTAARMAAVGLSIPTLPLQALSDSMWGASAHALCASPTASVRAVLPHHPLQQRIYATVLVDVLVDELSRSASSNGTGSGQVESALWCLQTHTLQLLPASSLPTPTTTRTPKTTSSELVLQIVAFLFTYSGEDGLMAALDDLSDALEAARTPGVRFVRDATQQWRLDDVYMLVCNLIQVAHRNPNHDLAWTEKVFKLLNLLLTYPGFLSWVSSEPLAAANFQALLDSLLSHIKQALLQAAAIPVPHAGCALTRVLLPVLSTLCVLDGTGGPVCTDAFRLWLERVGWCMDDEQPLYLRSSAIEALNTVWSFAWARAAAAAASSDFVQMWLVCIRGLLDDDEDVRVATCNTLARTLRALDLEATLPLVKNSDSMLKVALSHYMATCEALLPPDSVNTWLSALFELTLPPASVASDLDDLSLQMSTVGFNAGSQQRAPERAAAVFFREKSNMHREDAVLARSVRNAVQERLEQNADLFAASVLPLEPIQSFFARTLGWFEEHGPLLFSDSALVSSLLRPSEAFVRVTSRVVELCSVVQILATSQPSSVWVSIHQQVESLVPQLLRTQNNP